MQELNNWYALSCCSLPNCTASLFDSRLLYLPWAQTLSGLFQNNALQQLRNST